MSKERPLSLPYKEAEPNNDRSLLPMPSESEEGEAKGNMKAKPTSGSRGSLLTMHCKES